MNLVEKIYSESFRNELDKIAANMAPVIKDLATQRYLAKRLASKSIGDKPATTSTMKSFMEANKTKPKAGVAGYYTRGQGAI